MSPILIIAILAIAAGAGFLVLRKKAKSDPPASPGMPAASVDPMDPAAWEIGPIIGLVNYSKGMPLHPSADPAGWAFDLPGLGGHVDYLTIPCGSLAGKRELALRYRLELDPGARVVPSDYPTHNVALITLHFQRVDDDWSAKGKFEAYRWYATFATQRLDKAGEFEMTAPLDGLWTAVETSSAQSNPAGFADALEHAARVGFVLGGGTGYGHGVFVTGGKGRLIVTDFSVR